MEGKYEERSIQEKIRIAVAEELSEYTQKCSLKYFGLEFIATSIQTVLIIPVHL